MKPDHLPLLVHVSSLTVDPNGTRVVVATDRPDFDCDGYVGQLWSIPLGEGDPRRITRGRHDANAQFSPDGSLIAFTRACDKGGQLAVIPATGGEPMVITDQPLGVGDFAWFPDSAQIAFTARVPEDGRYGSTDGVEAGQEDPRHFTGNQIRANGLGWYNDRRSQLFSVDVPDVFGEPPVEKKGRAAKAAKDAHRDPADDGQEAAGLVPKARQLTSGDTDWSSPVVTADGAAVIAVAARHDTREDDLVADLYRVPLDQPDHLVRLTNLDGATLITAASPCVSGDGKHVFFIACDLGTDGLDFVGHHGCVWVVPATGGTPRRLTDLTYTVQSLATSGDDAVLFIANHEGSGRVHRVTLDGTVADLFSDEALSVTEVVERPGSTELVGLVTSPTSSGDVALLTADASLLTDLSAPLRSATTIVEPKVLEATAPDGYRVHGWLLTPPGDGPHPVLLNIHGGPYASYGSSFFDEFQVWVEAGYAVVACNPRGAGGYGSDHGRAIKGDFGNLDLADVLAFLDHAVATHPALDGARVGIMGGSYGGYLTAWTIAHDHRWAGAIVERGFLDPWSFTGASDIGWFFAQQYNGFDKAEMDRQSPMLLTSQVTTPTLVLHSEQDLRCPLSQALQYYTLLRQQGVCTELLVFPGENHELSRSGTPWHRRQRFEAILGFWAKHLPVS